MRFNMIANATAIIWNAEKTEILFDPWSKDYMLQTRSYKNDNTKFCSKKFDKGSMATVKGEKNSIYCY